MDGLHTLCTSYSALASPTFLIAANGWFYQTQSHNSAVVLILNGRKLHKFKHAGPLWMHISYTATAPPTGVTAVQEGPTSVTVSWTQSGTVTGYWINYVSAGGEDSGSAGPITGTSHTLDNLQDGLTYTITVIAMGNHLPSQSTQNTVQICKLRMIELFRLMLFCLQPFCLQAI